MSGDAAVRSVAVPSALGAVVDLASVRDGDRPVWITLNRDGELGRWNTATGDHAIVARSSVPDESGREPWNGRVSRPRLHAAANGAVAAVVNDYGRHGQVLDLGTGAVTLRLDNGGDHDETVPFSLAFTDSGESDVVVHRTAWNRLDAHDALTGRPLTLRPSPEASPGGECDDHYLDYFHGALYVSPDHRRILDDGWVWHPVGIPAVWDLGAWLGGQVWESEDGDSRVDVCVREYYWDHAMTWIDSRRVAVSGLGDDEEDMRPGARVFDATATARDESWNRPTAVELGAFAGPRGPFFSDGTQLFAHGDNGFGVWDPDTGQRVRTVTGFHPTHHHRAAGQFAELDDGRVRLWHR